MKPYKLSTTSLVISTAGLVVQFIINYKMSLRYISADGKTKGLFGLVELFSFSYKYYFLILGIIAFAIRAVIKKEPKWWANTALFVSILSIASVFVSLWRLIV